MKPPPFDYTAPTTAEEVLSLLGEHGDAAKILAGGQSLVPMLNFRLIQPQVLIDINRINSLAYVVEDNGGLRIGSLTRHRALENSRLIQSKCPLLAFSAQFIGHLAIRNRGTVGGSLAHADPAAELPVVLAVLDGQMVVRGAQGKRTLGPTEFFRDYLTTALQPTEFLTEVWVPALGRGTGWGFQELAQQHGAFALVVAAALITLDGEGVCTEARLALGNVGPTPVRVKSAENLLKGGKPDEKLLAEAARMTSESVEPREDTHASPQYRTAMAEVFARRALEGAFRRARQGH